jgi:hypothetical protein
VREDLKGKGLGKQAVCQIREFLRSIVKTTVSIDNKYILLGMSKVTKPNGFFTKLGFSLGLPDEFNCWADVNLSMAYDHVEPYCADDVLTACGGDITPIYTALMKAHEDFKKGGKKRRINPPVKEKKKKEKKEEEEIKESPKLAVTNTAPAKTLDTV